MGRRLTQEQVIERIVQIHGNTYDLSRVNYRNKRTKIELVCKIHGVFKSSTDQLFRGQGCSDCGHVRTGFKKRLSKKEVLNQFNLVHNGKYDYSKSDYQGMNKKIKIICKKNGDFKQTSGSHLNGSGCPKCGTESQIEKRKLGLREFIKRSKIRHREKYDYSNVNYKNQTKEVEIVCNIHGVFFQKPQYHISGSGCPKCSIIEQHEKQKKTLDEFIEDSMKVHGKKYDYSRSKYITSKDKITIICKKHGEFYSTPNNHLRGTGCPNCNISKGEEEIRLFLKSQKINFSTQHTFESLKMKRKLKCDFFLREFNLVIEYNGIQHYEPREFSGGINGLLRIQESDKLKEDYCKKNGIGFEVIRFDEDISERINEILKKYFKKRKEDIFK